MNKKIFDYPINPKCEIGDMIGNWKIIKLDHSETNDYAQGGCINTYPSNFWLCECQCKYHTRKVIKESWLLKGQKPKCNRCLADDNPNKSVRGREYSGMRIGFIEVIKPHEYTEKEKEEFYNIHGKKPNRSYDCACHRCGRGIAPRKDYFILDVSALNNRMLRDNPSCGCYNKDMLKEGKYHATHGMNGTRIYKIWQNMKSRCNNPNRDDYKYYGGKGVTICKEWYEFDIFYDWAINNGYSDNLTIDRIDSNGNYEPSNCRWVTFKDQMNNTSRNRIIKLGNEEYTMSQLADMSNVSYGTFAHRVNSNESWSENDMLFIPAYGNQYGRERYREEHGIVDALIFNDDTESSNKEIYRLSWDQINNILSKAPTAEDVFNKHKSNFPNLINL